MINFRYILLIRRLEMVKTLNVHFHYGVIVLGVGVPGVKSDPTN